MRQTNKKTTHTFRAVHYNGFTIEKSPKIYSNTANNFSSDAGKQLLIANEKNRFRWVVLCISQDGACIDLLENHSENSLKEDLSNITTFNPPLFSLVNTFKY
jgi:hypothetical protein